MKILMFVTNPCINDPRVYNEARSLVKAGHQVTVIAWDRYKQNQPLKSVDGIEIVQVRTWLSARWGPGDCAVARLSFAFVAMAGLPPGSETA